MPEEKTGKRYAAAHFERNCGGNRLSESMKYLTSGKWWLAFFTGLCLVQLSLMVDKIGNNLDLEIAEGEILAVLEAIASGYRLIDTSAAYGNEEAVGAAIKKCGIPREELFITTKLWVQDASAKSAKAAVETSLKKLGLEYLDLYLIHQPMGDYYGAYRVLEELYKEGVLRAIGVCNFYPHVLTDLCETVEVIPAVNQVELHPFFQQEDALKQMKEYGVWPEAWGPFAEGKYGIFTHPVLTGIGEKYGKSAAQVALRWNIQSGVAVIPKSVHKERIEQNMDIWDFVLSEEDMKEISELDIGHSEIVDHYNPAFVKLVHSMKIHE